VGFFLKPVVGFSDAATDVFASVQSSTRPSAGSSARAGSRESSAKSGGGSGGDSGGSASRGDDPAVKASSVEQARPARAFYGAARAVRAYQPEDALAVQLLRTVIADQSQPTLLSNMGGVSEGSGRSSSSVGVGSEEEEEEYLEHLDLGAFVLLLSTRRLLVVDDGGRTHLALWLKNLACCERRPDGVALHLFDPVAVTAAPAAAPTAGRRDEGGGGGVNHRRAREEERAHVRAASAHDPPPPPTLVRFIKCADDATRRGIDERIQRALQQLV
jgi:hypothetical protein